MADKLCPDCGKPMQMYYTMQCFHCKKPIPDKRGRGNLFKAMYWLKNNESEFNKDKFWRTICDQIPGNDTWIQLYLGKTKDELLFKKHFPIDDILWEVSW